MSYVPSLTPGYPSGVPPYAPAVDLGSDGVAEVPAAVAVGYSFATLTISGTAASGHVLNTSVNSIAASYTMTGGDSNTTAATNFATAINNVTALAAIVTATASSNVVTITSLLQGPAGAYPITASATSSSTITLSGATLDFAKNFIIPLQTFSWADGNDGGAITYYAGIPVPTTARMKAQIIAAGLAT